MLKNKSYIGISLIVLLFGIWAVPKIVEKVQTNSTVSGDRLNHSDGSEEISTDLITIGKAPKFELTNQNGKKVSTVDLKGKVYVLEFFFTTCPTICPRMNQNMLEIEKQFFGQPDFSIVSITIDPEKDTQKQLKEHADQLGVTSSKWHFLTGDKTYIFDLANNGFNLFVGQNTAIDGGFEHSGFFALIDKNGNIRSRKDKFGNPIAYYDGIEKPGVEAIMQDIAILLKE